LFNLKRGNYVGPEFTYPPITATVSILAGSELLLSIQNLKFYRKNKSRTGFEEASAYALT
jgi:hypothetical protein